MARLYQQYKDTEITFNTPVLVASGLLTTEVYLTIGDAHLSCVLYACSMTRARLIADIPDAVLHVLRSAHSLATLRLGFHQKSEPHPSLFFVSGRVESLAEYNPQKPSVRFVTFEFTQRPAETLVGVLGSLLEIRANALKRRDERIVLTSDALRRIGLSSRESCVAIGGAPHRCILRDLSFGGAKVLTTAANALSAQTRVALKLARCELRDDTVLDGSIVRVEDVEGRTDVVALSIQFSADPPISYKQKINSCFAQGGTAP
ncbi:MAG TPA: PilZ domain-containing protein [Spirochaetia bacterium]